MNKSITVFIAVFVFHFPESEYRLSQTFTENVELAVHKKYIQMNRMAYQPICQIRPQKAER